MKLWGYYAFHTFINTIKKMFRSTFIIVMAAIIGISVIFGVAIGVVATVIEENMTEEGTENDELREGYGDPEYGMFDANGEFLFYEDLVEEGLGGYDENDKFIYYEDALEQGLGYYDEHGDFIFYYEEFTEEDMRMLLPVVESIVVVIVLAILFMGAYSGMKKGSDIFVMADVNFLFTAPMKPQSVLLFRLTFQMLTTIAGSIYLLFQIPNLVINAGVPLEVCLMVFLALIITFIYQKLFSVGMYTITATHEKTRKFALPVIIGICVILVGIVGLVFMSTGMDVWKTLELTVASDWTRMIPIVGWIKGLVVHAVNGNATMILVYIILNIIGMAALVYFIWHMKADFYEDAMAGAQARADLIQAAAENRKVVEVNTDGTKKKDKRQVKDSQTSLFGKATGASVFYTKELIVRKRLAKFGVITNTMLWYFSISALMALFMVKVVEEREFAIIGVILMMILFFRNYGNPIAQETAMNWLFLVPESPYKKVFFAMMAGTYAAAMDLLPGVIATMLIMELNPATVLLWYVVLVTMDFMLSGVGLLLEALFPASAMEMVKASIQMVLKFAVILVLVVAFVIGMIIGGVTGGLVAILIVNIAVGAVSFLVYPAKLHSGIA